MAEFLPAFDYAVANEGGFSNNPHDSGGATKYGITQNLATHYGYDVRKLTEEEAAEIYYKEFWRFDGIANQRVASKIFDMKINLTANAIRVVQMAVFEFNPNFKVDGHYGPNTEEAINSLDPDRFLNVLIEQLSKYYENRVAQKPDQEVFLKGWLNRARRLPE